MLVRTFVTLFIFLTANFSVFAQAELEVGSHIVIDTSTKLRSASFFAGSTYLKGVLPKDSICRILNVDLNKTSGVGVYIKVISGPNEGQTGWVYYHNDESDRTLSLHSADGKEVELSSTGEVRDYFKKTQEFLKENVDGFVDATTVLPTKYKIVETDDEIWNNINSGKYTIKKVDPLDGVITINRPTQNSQGKMEDVEINIPYDFERLLKFPSSANSTTYGLPASGNENCGDDKDNSNHYVYEFQKGCEVLTKDNLTDDYDGLAICLSSIKKMITKDGVSNSKVKTNLYKLNPLEQEFAAMTLTAYGESGILTPPLEEMVMIMKTLENRVDYAKEKGYANALDAAIQTSQFSMWSNGYRDKEGKFQFEQWYHAVRASEHNNSTINSIKSFILYKKSRFGPSSTVNDVYHYHTNYVSPAWKNNSKIVKVKVNNKSLKSRGTRHIFYRNIPWTFAYTKYKPTSQR